MSEEEDSVEQVEPVARDPAEADPAAVPKKKKKKKKSSWWRDLIDTLRGWYESSSLLTKFGALMLALLPSLFGLSIVPSLFIIMGAVVAIFAVGEILELFGTDKEKGKEKSEEKAEGKEKSKEKSEEKAEGKEKSKEISEEKAEGKEISDEKAEDKEKGEEEEEELEEEPTRVERIVNRCKEWYNGPNSKRQISAAAALLALLATPIVIGGGMQAFLPALLIGAGGVAVIFAIGMAGAFIKGKINDYNSQKEISNKDDKIKADDKVDEIEQGVIPTSTPEQELMDAVKEKNIKGVKDILNNKNISIKNISIIINTTDESGKNALDYAAEKSAKDMIQTILESKQLSQDTIKNTIDKLDKEIDQEIQKEGTKLTSEKKRNKRFYQIN